MTCFWGQVRKPFLHIPFLYSFHFKYSLCRGVMSAHARWNNCTHKVKGCSVPGSMAQKDRPAFPANTSSLVTLREDPRLDYGAHVHLQLVFVPISSPCHHFSTFFLRRCIFSD